MKREEDNRILKGFVFRVYPTKASECLINKTFGCGRLVYNNLLEEFNREKNFKAVLEKEKKLKEEFPFLKEIDSISLQQKRIDLKNAVNNFFNKNHKSKKLKFKSKKGEQSYRTVSTNNNIKINFETHKLTLPKIGEVRFRDLRTFDGEIRQVRVWKSKTDKYYASILVRFEETYPDLPKTIQESDANSYDMGLTHFLTDSDGIKVENPRFYRKAEKQIGKHQKRLSKKKKGSKNEEKQRKKLAQKCEKAANKRLDFTHKLSTSITKSRLAHGAESLNICGMLKNHKLAKSISDAAWGLFLNQLKYKCKLYGRHFHQVDRFFPSSKKCICGYKNKKLTLSVRIWTCPECGRVHDRDLLAAKNINRELLYTLGTRGIYACGDSVRPKSKSCDFNTRYDQG